MRRPTHRSMRSLPRASRTAAVRSSITFGSLMFWARSSISALRLKMASHSSREAGCPHPSPRRESATNSEPAGTTGRRPVREEEAEPGRRGRIGATMAPRPFRRNRVRSSWQTRVDGLSAGGTPVQVWYDPPLCVKRTSTVTIRSALAASVSVPAARGDAPSRKSALRMRAAGVRGASRRRRGSPRAALRGAARPSPR